MSEEQSTTLPFYVENIEDVPNEVRAFYTQDEQGSFNLNVDGVVSKRKLDEFRDNNRKLSSQLQDIESKYRHVDLDEYKKHEAKVKAVYELSSLTRIMQEQDINLPTDPFLSRSRKQFKDLNQSYKVSKENKEWFIESLRAEDYKLIDYIRNQSYYIP